MRATLFRLFCYGRFTYLSAIRKKVFLRAPVKWFCLYSSQNSYSVVFQNNNFREIKNHSLRATTLPEFFLLWKPLVCVYLMWKAIFSRTSERRFSLGLKSLSFFLGGGDAAFGRIKGHSLSIIDLFFKCFFTINFFSRHLTSVEKYLVG